MKFGFAGTAEFGLPSLEKLLAAGHSLVFVITQPDKPVGRKQTLSPSPVKSWAEKRGIPILQPIKISDAKTAITDANIDLLVVAAYGQIIPTEVLGIPKYGSVNIHGSVLPKYRGASPIQAALSNGESEIGITIIKMDEKMDHGPVIATASIPISNEEQFPEVYKKLSQLAAESCVSSLPRFIAGEIKPEEQNHGQATFTKLLKKTDARIDWTKPAKEIHNLVRALNPEPGTWTTLDGKSVKILQTRILPSSPIELPGKVFKHMDGLAAKSQDYAVLLIKVQPEGKLPMSGKDFANGLKDIERLHFI